MTGQYYQVNNVRSITADGGSVNSVCMVVRWCMPNFAYLTSHQIVSLQSYQHMYSPDVIMFTIPNSYIIHAFYSIYEHVKV